MIVNNWDGGASRMITTSPFGPFALAGPPAFGPAIRSVQPDRHHGVLEVVGALGHDDAAELRQRVEGCWLPGCATCWRTSPRPACATPR